MFFPSFKPTPTAQVWPGNGINVVSVQGAPLRVVSTFSRFLNSESWYFASSVSSWGKEFKVYQGLPQSKSEDLDDWSFAESYFDRAVLNQDDWIPYSPPTPAVSPKDRTPYSHATPEVSSESRSYGGQVTPVLILNRDTLPPAILRAPAIPVWVEFFMSNEVLSRIAWSIEGRVDWGGELLRYPSGFVITDTTTFSESSPPASGVRYTGGLRPVPWTG